MANTKGKKRRGRKPTAEQLAKSRAKRLALSQLSQIARFKIDTSKPDPEVTTVNSWIMKYVHRTGENHTFNTFKQWRELGYKVVKGSTACTIWGAPIKGKSTKETTTTAGTETAEESFSMFPLCHLFSNTQVQPIDPDNVQPVPNEHNKGGDIIEFRYFKEAAHQLAESKEKEPPTDEELKKLYNRYAGNIV